MAEDRDEARDPNNQTNDEQAQHSAFTSGQQQQSELRQQNQQQGDNFGSQPTMGSQSWNQPSGSENAQPIGGNDSNIGSGTTLSQSGGSDIGSSGQGSGLEAGQSGQSQYGSSSDTLTRDQDSNSDQPSRSGSEGFIGSQGSGSDDYIQQDGGSDASASSANATGGSDFAREGRGSLDRDDDDSDSGTSPGGLTDGTGSGS